MKSPTQIEQWQLQSQSDSNSFNLTVLRDMQDLVLKETEWVESDSGDVEYWKRFRVRVSKCLDTMDSPWKDSPDPQKSELWNTKQIALTDLTKSVYLMYVKYSYDPYLTAIYKEKLDQAIDFTTDVVVSGTADVNEYPLIKMHSEIDRVDPMEAAQQILDKNSMWLKRMEQIERIRISTRREILHCGSTKRLQQIVNEAVELLNGLDQQWT